MALFDWFGRGRRDRDEASRLIAEHGPAAWQLVYVKCRNRALPEDARGRLSGPQDHRKAAEDAAEGGHGDPVS